jgi:hypothetical protein
LKRSRLAATPPSGRAKGDRILFRLRECENPLMRVGIASLCAVVSCALLCTTQMSKGQTGETGNDHKARAYVGGALADRSYPGLGWPNPLRLRKPLIDPSGNIVHRNIEIVNSPTLIPRPPVDASLLLPTSLNSGSILINIDIMQLFIPWEYRVAGALER